MLVDHFPVLLPMHNYEPLQFRYQHRSNPYRDTVGIDRERFLGRREVDIKLWAEDVVRVRRLR